VAQFSIVQEHIDLTVTATSVVDVGPRLVPPSGSGPSWEQARDLVASSLEPMELDARSFVLDSPSVPLTDAVRAYASTSFTVGRPLVDVLSDLTLRIHADFEYEPGATDLQTTPDEALLLRKGVCQDFAHLQVACLRSFGIAARYVSGYLETIAPPGQPKLLGADVSHAWVSAFLPSFGWVDVDPTNNLFVGDRHVTTSWGRDYADVSPLKGVIYTEATTNLMTVSVDVTSQP
jgi:transglutaminase-like putative cysteine protease